MKNIYVSMSLDEGVLDSYLQRVFEGKLIEKKTCKVVYFPEMNLTLKPAWTKRLFRDFCESTIDNKRSLRIYKAKQKREVSKV